MKNKSQTRDRILRVGAEIIHRRGFNNTGIQEILRRAEVPKGSFYFYFRSKSDFGLQLIDHYEAHLVKRLERYLARQDLPPLERLRCYFREFREGFEQNACRGGCPVGNLAQEMGDLDESFRLRLDGVFRNLRYSMERALRQAGERGDLPADKDPGEMAQFILNSWQGAILQMKVEKSTAPLQCFERVVFQGLIPAESER